MSTADAPLTGVVDPQPALAHPATRDQQWHVKHLWGVVAIGSGMLYPMSYLMLSGQVHDLKGYLIAVAILVGWALPFLALAWYLDPAVRQRRYLRKYPWVAFPAKVTSMGRSTSLGNVIVRFTDERQRQWSYRVAPNDAEFEEGERPIWFAGEPGRTAAVISLREGACTGMAYRSGSA